MEDEESHLPPASKQDREESWATQLSRFRLPLIIGTVSILLIVLSITLLIKSIQTTTPIRFSSESVSSPSGQSKNTDIQHYIMVDIEGAVTKPGVYRLPEGSRVEDALVLAGGLNKEADVSRIAQTVNRAAKLVDGAKLYFFSKSDSGDNIIVRRDSASAQSSGSPVGNTAQVNINSASQTQLEALSGVGPATAVKIINGRPYQTLEELVSKKAIGKSLFEKLKIQLTL